MRTKSISEITWQHFKRYFVVVVLTDFNRIETGILLKACIGIKCQKVTIQIVCNIY